jgi:hypothetical protein
LPSSSPADPIGVRQLETYIGEHNLGVAYGYLWFVLLYSLAMQLVPWVFARRRGWRGVWTSVGTGPRPCRAQRLALAPLRRLELAAPISVLVTAIWVAAASPAV